MNFVHPETMKILLSTLFFLAKTLRRQQFMGLAPLRPSHLRREKGFAFEWCRVPVIFRALPHEPRTPGDMKILLSSLLSPAKTQTRQELTGPAPLRPSRLCEREFASKW
jgi:hypothetical protein